MNNLETLEIPDGAWVVTVKVNVDQYTEEQQKDLEFLSNLPQLMAAQSYLYDCRDKAEGQMIACTAGVHYNGRNEKAHIHHHYIFSDIYQDGNASQHRKRWLAKNRKENPEYNFIETEIKYTPLDPEQPKYHTLAYPMKEGHVLSGYGMCWTNKGPMNQVIINSLKAIGEEIYNTQKAAHERREKSDARKKNTLLELFELVKDQKFSNFGEMRSWLDENYISTLDLADYPDPKNYKTNCQKIAVRLKLLKYSEL